MISFDQVMAWLLHTASEGGQAILCIALILLIGILSVRFVRLGLGRLARIVTSRGKAGERVSGSAHTRAVTLTGVIRTIAVTAIRAIVERFWGGETMFEGWSYCGPPACRRGPVSPGIRVVAEGTRSSQAPPRRTTQAQ